MLFIAGISSKLNQKGVAENSVCPACGRIASLHIIHKYMTPHIFFIPTVKIHSEYIATCTGCASVLELSPEKGREFCKNPDVNITADDLIVKQNNVLQICASCGGRIHHGQAYCGHCGQKA